LLLTTPNIITSYNKAIYVFTTMMDPANTESYTWEDMRANIRDTIRHAGAREWAIKVVDTADIVSQHSTTINKEYLNAMKLAMSYFLRQPGENSSTLGMHVKFNSQYGEAVGRIWRRVIEEGDTTPTNWNGWKNFGTPKEIEEDIGDMISSNYIIIRDKNYPKSDGSIAGWTENQKTSSHRIYHDFDMTISNLTIQYKNMYL